MASRAPTALVIWLTLAAPTAVSAQTEAADPSLHTNHPTGGQPSVSITDARRGIAPLELAGEHGRLGVGFGLHLRTTLEHDDGGSSQALEIHRLRLFLRGSFLGDRLRTLLHIGLTPKWIELVDVYGDAVVGDAFVLRVGAQKVPFTNYFWLSFPDFALAEWPVTIAYFGGGRQLGVTLLDPRPGPGWRYALGVFQGQSLRPRNGAFLPTVYGDTPRNHLDLRAHDPLGDPHPEIIGRLSFEQGSVLASASAAWDARPTHGVDETLRLALDARLIEGPLTLWAAGYVSLVSDLEGHLDVGLAGSMVEVALDPHPRVQISVRHALVVFTDHLRADARAVAARRIAAAPDPEAQRMSDAEIGQVRAEHETMLGANVFVHGRSLKLQTDAAWTHRPGLDRDALRLRVQLQLVF